MPRAVVVGAGIMGTNHARLCAQLPEWELAAVVDPDRARAGALAEHHGVPAAASLPELDERGVDYDAAVVASPTGAHVELATWLLDRGVHVLVGSRWR